MSEVDSNSSPQGRPQQSLDASIVTRRRRKRIHGLAAVAVDQSAGLGRILPPTLLAAQRLDPSRAARPGHLAIRPASPRTLGVTRGSHGAWRTFRSVRPLQGSAYRDDRRTSPSVNGASRDAYSARLGQSGSPTGVSIGPVDDQ
jgi:hypothetical protein